MLSTQEKKGRRKDLWVSLHAVHSSHRKPWLIIGDFNSILHVGDRLGGNPVSFAEVVDFAKCVEDCGLIELPYLDWALINDEWLTNMPSSKTTFLPEGVSDHCPIKITLTEERIRKQSSFLYCNAWGQAPQFQSLVVKKLKLLKRSLKKLNFQYNDIMKKVDQNREMLKQAQKLLQDQPLNLEFQKMERDRYRQFKHVSHLAEMYLQQQSKVTWLKLGDDNTRYFFSVIKHRRLKLTITQLKDESGQWQTDQESIAQIFVNYYQKLLGEKTTTRVKAKGVVLQNGPVLGINLQMQLIEPFTEDDVKQAMFKIDKTKSPGPDGYGSGFFKEA
ncbi:hypothetical protein KY290_003975 [Solanum tuberosum]|uniref:Endonuclease/exonuclease/phosphatase domain-containing protein n=1 Tax=Solanum tuberosum TaxID=4113 RepID=A0ABQ7WUD6_SOLTU|nr:hypothetical protein KY290_003975 [Solanum tuberosum]